MDSITIARTHPITDAISVMLVIFLMIFLSVGPLFWTVRRILGPVDYAARDRNAPLRFSIGDFLCLFWFIQLPLAAVFQFDREDTEATYNVLFVLVWIVAPLVWFVCARTLSKAGIADGKHRLIYLSLVVPLVYYGLFPFIFLSWRILISWAAPGGIVNFPSRVVVFLWVAIGVGILASGLYTPWLLRQVGRESAVGDDAGRDSVD